MALENTNLHVTLGLLNYFKTKQDALNADTYLTKAAYEADTALATKVATLIGDDADKSVRTIANEELAKQLIPDNAKEALDTLGEIAAWIQSHPEDASAMNADISMIKTGLTGFITAGEGEGAHDVMSNVKSYIDTEDAKKVDKVEGSSLLADTEIARLAAMSDGANKAEVSVETLTAGTKIATVTIDGTATEIKAPTVSVSKETITASTKVGSVSVNGTETDIVVPTVVTSAEYTSGMKVGSVKVGDADAVELYVAVGTTDDIDAMFETEPAGE